MSASELLWHTHTHTIPAAFDLLPGKMGSLRAHAQLLAIELQESGCEHRVQVGGPARGLWQFEGGRKSALAGLVTNPATSPIVAHLCNDVLLYPMVVSSLYEAIAFDDVLACCLARLLLWTDPRPMPGPSDAETAWAIYLSTWRPGKPRRASWDGYYATAWALVSASVA